MGTVLTTNETATEPTLPVLAPGHVVQVPVGMLQPDPNQPRTEFDEAALKALAADIGARGIELPIVVRGDYTIKDGERRWRAAKLAGLAAVPCLLASTKVEEGEFAVIWKLDQVADNHHGEKLSALDWSRFLHELVHVHGLAVKDIPDLLAKRGITMSRSYVSNLIRLIELPEWAQAMVKAGTLTAAHGKHILTAKDSPAAMEAVRKEIEEWLEDEWNGPLTVAEMPNMVCRAFGDTCPELTNTYGSNAPRFDVATCDGCATRKTFTFEGSGLVRSFCLNAECFEQKQTAATEAANTKGGNKGSVRAATKPQLDPKVKAAQERVRQTEKAKKTATARAIEAIVAKADGQPGAEDLRLILSALLGWQNTKEIAERRGWDIEKSGDWYNAFSKRVDGMTAAELHGVLVEAALTGYRNTLPKVAHRHGIDLKALEKAALEELKKPAEKKPAKKKAPKKKAGSDVVAACKAPTP